MEVLLRLLKLSGGWVQELWTRLLLLLLWLLTLTFLYFTIAHLQVDAAQKLFPEHFGSMETPGALPTSSPGLASLAAPTATPSQGLLVSPTSRATPSRQAAANTSNGFVPASYAVNPIRDNLPHSLALSRRFAQNSLNSNAASPSSSSEDAASEATVSHPSSGQSRTPTPTSTPSTIPSLGEETLTQASRWTYWPFPIPLVLLAVSASPFVLGFFAAFLVVKRIYSVTYNLKLPDWYEHTEDVYWRNLTERAMKLWEYESLGRDRSLTRATDYAWVWGFLVSETMIACSIVFLVGTEQLQRRAIAISVALAVGFAISLGRILIRLSNSDISARMFAGAINTSLAVTVTALFLPAALEAVGNNSLCKSFVGCAAFGAAIGLLGQRALEVATSRAQGLLGAQPITSENRADLRQIDGLTEDDIDRLAEEGIDSVHALAFIPTPRLFFNTTYSLQRICDWQDQAILVKYIGKTRMQAFRDSLLVRGAIDAEAVSLDLLTETQEDALQLDPQPVAGRRRIHEVVAAKDTLFNLLGFGNSAQARVALTNIADDTIINQLKIFYYSGVQKVERGESALSDPNRGRFGGRSTANSRELSAVLRSAGFSMVWNRANRAVNRSHE